MNIDDIYADLQDMSNLSGPSLDGNTLTIEPDSTDLEAKTDWLLNNPFDFIEPMAMGTDEEFKDQSNHDPSQEINETKSDLDELLALVSPSSAIPDLNFGNPPSTSSPNLTLDAITTGSDATKGDFGKCIDQLVAETLQEGDMEREAQDENQNPLLTCTNSVGLEDFPELLQDYSNFTRTDMYHAMPAPPEEARHPLHFPITSMGGGFRPMGPMRPSYLPHPYQAVPPCRIDYHHAPPMPQCPGWHMTGMPSAFHENQPLNQPPSTENENVRPNSKPVKLWPDQRVTRRYKIEGVEKVPKQCGDALIGLVTKHSWGLSVKIVERPLKAAQEPKPLEKKKSGDHQLRRKSLNILRKRKLSK